MTHQLIVKVHKQLRIKAPRSQSGATLIVGLIMLVLITVIVLSAFTFSSSNLKSVGNMQIREEALAAANLATEQVIASPFTDAPTAQEIVDAIFVNVNIDFLRCRRIGKRRSDDLLSRQVCGCQRFFAHLHISN